MNWSLPNLAGVSGCDEVIRQELTLARIPIVEGVASQGEVPSTVEGKLGEFTFRRAWRYWDVRGPLPLAVAQALYADPAGRQHVRVLGHCGRPNPAMFAIHYGADGRELVPLSQEAPLRDFVRRGLITAEQVAQFAFVVEPAAEATRSFVKGYHIDSVVGLRLFADAVSALDNEGVKLQRFWVSWWGGDGEDCRPVVDAPPFQWWVSGDRDGDPPHSICAVLDAGTEEAAWRLVTQYWPEAERRFAVIKEPGWQPDPGRFPPRAAGRQR